MVDLNMCYVAGVWYLLVRQLQYRSIDRLCSKFVSFFRVEGTSTYPDAYMYFPELSFLHGIN